MLIHWTMSIPCLLCSNVDVPMEVYRSNVIKSCGQNFNFKKIKVFLFIVAYLTMLMNIIKIHVPTVPNWEIQVGKKHIASMCLNGTLV